MKKILSLAVLLAFSLAMYAQKDVTKFLGIPVDGTKSEMIKKLKEKGFTECSYDKDVLEGEFNGTDVQIFIVTNNNKVWRIAVADANTTMKCEQFKNNKKYTSFSSSDYTIPDDENISYEITVHNKRYEASFYQKPDSASMAQSVLSKYPEEQLDSLSEEEQKEVIRELVSYAVEAASNKSVWFMIAERLGGYYIAMYYDNEYNHAQGEDL